MVEVPLEGLARHVEEGTVQRWYYEEGDAVSEGDDLVELSSEEGPITIQVPCSGILAEVYYDEGDIVAKGEILCTIDDEEADLDKEDEEENK